MNNIEKQTQMKLINQHSRIPLTENDVYVFSVRLCNNSVDKDFEQFSEDTLNKLATMFVGKVGLIDCGIVSRIFKTEVCKMAYEKTNVGNISVYIKAWAYIVRSANTEPIIADIKSGVKREVSIACSVRRAVCSVCGDIDCHHMKGNIYSDNLCYLILEEPVEVFEWAFVKIPYKESNYKSDLTAASARIAELEAEVASREQSGIEEHNEVHYWRDKAKKAELDLSVLQSHDREAMELLGTAIAELTSLAISVREHCENIEPCAACAFSPENTEAIGECPGYETDHCFRWQHADRYEALKEQYQEENKSA